MGWARYDMTERAMYAGEPICKMQSLQLNNLKHSRNENPFSYAMPQLPPAQNRRQMPQFVRSRHCMKRRRRQRPSSAFYSGQRICGNAIFDARYQLHPSNSRPAQTHKNMAHDMPELHRMQCKQCFANIPSTFLSRGADPGWELHSDRHETSNLPFGVKAVTATAAARQAAARA